MVPLRPLQQPLSCPHWALCPVGTVMGGPVHGKGSPCASGSPSRPNTVTSVPSWLRKQRPLHPAALALTLELCPAAPREPHTCPVRLLVPLALLSPASAGLFPPGRILQARPWAAVWTDLGPSRPVAGHGGFGEGEQGGQARAPLSLPLLRPLPGMCFPDLSMSTRLLT